MEKLYFNTCFGKVRWIFGSKTFNLMDDKGNDIHCFSAGYGLPRKCRTRKWAKLVIRDYFRGK